MPPMTKPNEDLTCGVHNDKWKQLEKLLGEIYPALHIERGKLCARLQAVNLRIRDLEKEMRMVEKKALLGEIEANETRDED